MKFTSFFAIVFACLVASSVFYGVAEAKKKKLLGAFLIGAALASKPKVLPLPLPIPIPIQIKQEKHIPYAEPMPYPVYVDNYGHGGGHYGGDHGGHYGGGGYGGY